MKTMLVASFLLAFCTLASALEDKKADSVGTWKCEYEIGGQKRMSTLMIKKDGDKLAGTMSWPDQKETDLKDVKLTDGTLTFSALRKFMGNEITVEYKLAIDGGKLKGTGGAEFGGQKQEFEITGKRDKVDAPKGAEATAADAAGVVVPVRLASNRAPAYPAEARRQRLTGRVLLKAVILPTGEVGDLFVHTSSGHVILDDAATEAVRQWTFKPASRDGKNIRLEVLVPVRFQLP